MTTPGAPIRVEVAYALPGEQIVVCVEMSVGARVEDAIRASGILASCPDLDLRTACVGVFGRAVRLETPLRDRDRVEIYRPLVADAKEVRRQRARERMAARGKSGGR
jgi:putative ubiquitin-RnfH superfamily antitoxin RatB of RatAB toxin-antitoxin module